MRVLADENVDLILVEWLRDQSHDVISILEVARGDDDETVLERATRESRLLLTFDLDFGELTYRQEHESAGIVLLRLRSQTAAGLLTSFSSVWPQIEKHALGHFIVATNHRVRVRPLPSRTDETEGQ